MPASLKELNSASPQEAYDDLLACCGSSSWAARLLNSRPFVDLRSLEETADRLSRELTADDWLEAFASHPRIGQRKPGQSESDGRASAWSAQEQVGTRNVPNETLTALAAANLAYEERFGYIFIVCATGRSTEEMLAICHERLNNDAQSELLVAADELRQIAGIRLRRLTGVLD
ncbi:MAG: 2-oxo-4-hydroxy-4-carboxy-5-ureidoimidazoline decarboxylase [Acidobacteriota bacterium]